MTAAKCCTGNCRQGRTCPLRLDESRVEHLRYSVVAQQPVKLSPEAIRSMDETMEAK